MNDISKEIIELLERYQADTKQILTDYSRLDYLYALSAMRENLLEWYPFKEDGSLLQIGADYGALTGLYSNRVKDVTVLDSSEDQLTICNMRNPEADNICYVKDDIRNYAKHQKYPEGKFFDYIMLIGSLEPDYEMNIVAAKSLLKPGGELILAVCNPFGLKYWAGAKADEHSVSKQAVTRLLGEEEGTLEFYYPMPDYRLPIHIYSQSYLPSKGDWTNTLTAYDYPKYMMLDINAAYDRVCDEGQFEQFANSFLTIWRSHG